MASEQATDFSALPRTASSVFAVAGGLLMWVGLALPWLSNTSATRSATGMFGDRPILLLIVVAALVGAGYGISVLSSKTQKSNPTTWIVCAVVAVIALYAFYDFCVWVLASAQGSTLMGGFAISLVGDIVLIIASVLGASGKA